MTDWLFQRWFSGGLVWAWVFTRSSGFAPKSKKQAITAKCVQLGVIVCLCGRPVLMDWWVLHALPDPDLMLVAQKDKGMNKWYIRWMDKPFFWLWHDSCSCRCVCLSCFPFHPSAALPRPEGGVYLGQELHLQPATPLIASLLPWLQEPGSLFLLQWRSLLMQSSIVFRQVSKGLFFMHFLIKLSFCFVCLRLQDFFCHLSFRSSHNNFCFGAVGTRHSFEITGVFIV